VEPGLEDALASRPFLDLAPQRDAQRQDEEEVHFSEDDAERRFRRWQLPVAQHLLAHQDDGESGASAARFEELRPSRLPEDGSWRSPGTGCGTVGVRAAASSLV
jgi:hypothetical protein